MMKLRNLEVHPDEDVKGGAFLAIPTGVPGEDHVIVIVPPREVALVAAYFLRLSEELEEQPEESEGGDK